MSKRWTFTMDVDPRLIELRRQLLSRSTRSTDTEPLGNASFEVRAFSPAVPLEPSSLQTVHAMLWEFLCDLGSEFPLRPSLLRYFQPDWVDMKHVEKELWERLVVGIDNTPGVYEDDPSVAADWVTSLLVFTDDAAGSRHFRASYLFDVRGNMSIAWFIVAPARVAMICLVGSD